MRVPLRVAGLIVVAALILAVGGAQIWAEPPVIAPYNWDRVHLTAQTTGGVGPFTVYDGRTGKVMPVQYEYWFERGRWLLKIIDGPYAGSYKVFNGTTVVSYDALNGSVTYRSVEANVREVAHKLLSPSFVSAMKWSEKSGAERSLGESVVLGHRVTKIEKQGEEGVHTYWVNYETGVLLRYEHQLNGRTVGRFAVTSLDFSTPMPTVFIPEDAKVWYPNGQGQ